MRRYGWTARKRQESDCTERYAFRLIMNWPIVLTLFSRALFGLAEHHRSLLQRRFISPDRNTSTQCIVLRLHQQGR